MTIVIAGGSGFIGTELSRALLEKGHTVIVVDKHSPQFTHEKLFFIQCDLALQPLPYNVLERTDVIINLVGSSILKRVTQKYKAEIYTSRIRSTRTIVDAIAAAQTRPTVFISASSIRYYEDTGENIFDESGARGNSFLSHMTEEWENEAARAQDFGVRVVVVRSAPILGHGGAMSAVTRSIPFALIRLTKKEYWMSWIHERDIVAIYLFALETTTLQGVINATAPEPVQHSTYIRLLSKILHRPILGTLPKFVLHRLYGDLFLDLVKNTRVIPKRLVDKGFNFLYPNIEVALKEFFRKEPRE